ncbi:Low-density lipoprotein receptor domain class A [Ancylostoma duodenale]|uniref:Low-density lipoprotein receptor domain class A n=1 Tax=Ancylostoma duodenale TaxID=51022 RepID=A0A0C2GYE7_9BILA|nr:Low-density lipoprotein receptor domain class A [Ancylostoma duodenale]
MLHSRRFPRLKTTDSPPPPKGRLERFRDYIGRTCCSCFLKVLRDNHLFPKPDPLDGDDDDVVDELRRDGIRVVHGIPSTALFPPNVSLCEGFGFACTNQPVGSLVISTALRCDGKADCPDGSDELNCKDCQSAFSCSISPKSKVKVCLRAEQLCDGIAHCPDGYDEEKHCKSTCDDDEMSCPSTSLCLPPSSVCDGIVDCDTEEDEVNCEECTRGAQFCEVTKRCIPAGQLCDGIPQCPDRSDEKGCDCRACSGSGKALCADGECLERSRVCDGVVDCSDGIDEKDCPGSCLLEQDEQIPYVKCADGRRYPEAEACSGVIEQCAYNCTKCDPRLAFTCNDKKCVPQMLVGFATESMTAPRARMKETAAVEWVNFTICSIVEVVIFVNPGSRQVRVPISVWKKEVHCEEEAKCSIQCPRDSIRCPGEGKCIPMISRCDGVADCRDGSDETDCTCQECIGRHWNTYMCGAKSHCFRRDEVCAPYTLCPNATKADKVFCAGRALRGVDWLR